MEYQGIALSLEPFTTEPCPEFFCSHLIKLNALLMSFSQTEHPKAAVRTALLGSLLPLAGELPAAAQALRPWWDRARGHEDTCAGTGSVAVPTCDRCALLSHATPRHVAHTHPTRTQHRTRGTVTLELLLIFF